MAQDVFSAADAADGTELWVTDGTAGGTRLVKDINPGSGDSYPGYLTALGNGKAVFQADNGTNGYEVWVTDGTAGGTSLVKDINPGSNGSGNGRVLFAAGDGTNGSELWVTDGTAGGTSLVKDINPGANNSNPQNITVLGDGTVLFTSPNGTNLARFLGAISPAPQADFWRNPERSSCAEQTIRQLPPATRIPVDHAVAGRRP